MAIYKLVYRANSALLGAYYRRQKTCGPSHKHGQPGPGCDGCPESGGEGPPSPSSSIQSLLLAPALYQAHRLWINIISIWTYPSAAVNLLQILSENSGNFYSDMTLGSY